MGDAPLLEVMLPFWGDPQLLYDAVESRASATYATRSTWASPPITRRAGIWRSCR